MINHQSDQSPVYFYSVIADQENRYFIPLTGPHDTREEAEALCDRAVYMYIERFDDAGWLWFMDNGVLKTHKHTTSVYGTTLPAADAAASAETNGGAE